jgi:hypothetical protein
MDPWYDLNSWSKFYREEALRLQEQLRKNRKARGSSRLAALVKRGRLLVEVAH